MSLKILVVFSLLATTSTTTFAQIKLSTPGLEKQIEAQRVLRTQLKHSESYDLNLDGKPDVAIQFVETSFSHIRFLVYDPIYGTYDVYDPENFGINDLAGLYVDWDAQAMTADRRPARISTEIEYFSGKVSDYYFIVPTTEVAQKLAAFLKYLQLQALLKQH